jgi:hypothetical protein
MNLRTILLKYFLPFVLVFMTLSVLSLLPSVQKTYYPLFKSYTISSLNKALTDTYFKAKPKGENTDYDYNTVAVLFQSKRQLTAVTNEAKRTNTQPRYNYLGFKITIDETFVAPLIFFLCLLLFTPSTPKRKLISLILGTLLILAFAYLIIYFKGLYMVSKSGVRDLAYNQNDINFFQTMHFFFSSVTIVTAVLITWILVTFRKSDLTKLFEQGS